MAIGTPYRSGGPVLVLLLLVLLLAGWLYLYTHSRTVDPAEQNRTLTLLKDLKQIDSDWSASVLRAHADISPNYDELVEPLEQFSGGLQQLRARVAPAHARNLDDALAELGKQVDAKAALIDDFKAQNSLFKNSLRYVPTAHRQIQAITAAMGHQADLDRRIGFLVNESLRFAAVPDGEVAASLRAGIGELRGAIATYPTQVREAVLNLLSHLDTLLRLRTNQSELLHAISQQPVAASIDALSSALTQRFSNELATQFGYHRLLLAYSAFALLLVIGGASFISYRNATERRRLSALVDAKTRELRELATRDDLTGIYNRRHISQLLEQQQALHARSGLPMCIALLDLDRFKSINDRYGHAGGDTVLQRFATIARQTLRTTDLLGRWGGEEFLVAMPQTSLEQAGPALQRIREVLAGVDFGELGEDLHMTFSAGLVLLDGGETIAEAVKRADQAMYRAKTAGRDRVETG
ncbi:MAG: diguanylate cyclase [Burkholderiaceae bacterium]